MEERDFHALMLSAEACGDREIIISDVETKRPDEAAVIIDPSFKTFESMKFRPDTYLGVVDINIFGMSGRWGCSCLASLDDVGVVGGDTHFMETFLVEAGGLRNVRERFDSFAANEWSVSDNIKRKIYTAINWNI